MAITIDELTRELRDVALAVTNAEDRKEERDVVMAAHERVTKVSAEYRQLLETLSEAERMGVERSLGRRMQDIRRMAAMLPRIGSIAESTPDRRVDGPSHAEERRITGVSWGAGAARGPAGPLLRVGREVEAWCGPCGGLKTHKIVAMIGSEPRQVVCDACNSRHNYRTTPARRTSDGLEAVGTTTVGHHTSEAERQAQRKADEQRALAKEVALAAEVKSFDPKARYRTGDVISHPAFGRGKVETVLRSSLLVRFASGGLKSVMLD
jgi:hypothetical protein